MTTNNLTSFFVIAGITMVCSVSGCQTGSHWYKGPKYTLHRFPHDPILAKLWVDQLDRLDFIPAKSSVVCSKHFTQDCFDSSMGSRGRIRKNPKLKDNAIPTLYLHPEESAELPQIIASKPEIVNGYEVRFIGAKPEDPLLVKDEVIEDIQSDNPWDVASRDDFLFYCCPRTGCDSKSKNYDDFYQHAVETHFEAKYCLDQLKDPLEDIEAKLNQLDEELMKTKDLDKVKNKALLLLNHFYRLNVLIPSVDLDTDIEEEEPVKPLENHENEVTNHELTSNGKLFIYKGRPVLGNKCDQCLTYYHPSISQNRHLKESCQGPVAKKSRKQVLNIKEDFKEEHIKVEVDPLVEEPDPLVEELEPKQQIVTEVPKPIMVGGSSSKGPKRLVKTTSHSNPIWQCYFCGSESESEFTIKNHILKEHHPEVNKNMYGVPLVLQCEVCKHMQKNEDHLKLHICGTIPPRWLGGPWNENLTCPKCPKICPNYNNLLKHHAMHHTTEKKYKCDTCDHKTFLREQMRVHAMEHTTSLVCDICGSSFKNVQILKKHKKEIHEGKKPPSDAWKNYFKCDMCDYRGKSKDIQIHTTSEHPDAEVHRCGFCPFTTNVKGLYKKHLSKSHNNKECQESSHVCFMCGKNFVSNAKMKDHLIGVHGIDQDPEENLKGEKKNHICETCGKTFDSYTKWYHHVMYHHSQKYFACTLCDQRIFSSITKIIAHLNNDHAREDVTLYAKNTYCCDKCDKTYTEVKDLNTHLMKEHQMNCDINCPEEDCPDWFVSPALLTAHRIECHNFDPILRPQKEVAVTDYRCDICGQYYKSQTTLHGHIMGVHKKSEHHLKCAQCDFKTYRESILKMHVKKSHDQEWKQMFKKHQCTECDQEFGDRRYLMKHLMDVHCIMKTL